MKRNNFYKSILVLILMGIVFSCVDDGGLEVNTNPGAGFDGPLAIIVTADWSEAFGAYSLISLLPSHNVAKNVGLTSNDVGVTSHNGKAYIINRWDANNIMVLDPLQGYGNPFQFSVSPDGSFTNPQDIAILSDTKAYVSLLGTDYILVVNPQSGAELGRIDLSGYADDEDGLVEATGMVIVENRLFVAIQHLNQDSYCWPPVSNGEIVVINTDTVPESIVGSIALSGKNPATDLQYVPWNNTIYLGTTGDISLAPTRCDNPIVPIGSYVTDDDGGVESITIVDIATDSYTPNVLVNESQLGGSIRDVEILSATKGFAIIATDCFVTSPDETWEWYDCYTDLVSFNPSTGALINGSVFLSDGSEFLGGERLVDLAINSFGEVWVAYIEPTAPGVLIFDGITDLQIGGTIGVGLLPPVGLAFIQ